MRILKGSTAVRVAVALALGIVVGSLPSRPAFADRNDRPAQDERRGGDRDHRDNERRPDNHYREHRRYPVYAPPPVYYPRERSPGISLFFPVEIR